MTWNIKLKHFYFYYDDNEGAFHFIKRLILFLIVCNNFFLELQNQVLSISAFKPMETCRIKKLLLLLATMLLLLWAFNASIQQSL